GAQLGLSIYPNSKCTKRLDAIDLMPNTASVQTGQSVNFNVTGRLCDGSSTSPQVTYAVMPSGTIGPNGVFSSNTAGTYRVVARTLNGKLADTSTVTVTAPPPPPPPPRLSRIEISPKSSNLKLGESATYAVTGYWSDGNSRPMRADECSVSAEGNPTASGWTYSWSRSGDYGVTATCSGNSDRATAAVRGLSVVLRAMFGTNKYNEASAVDRMSLDQVAENMKADQTIRVYIDGHTDWRNSVKYNAWLSQKRAEFIQRELVKRGIDKARTTVRAFGECKPATDNGTEEGMAQNRRVELNQIETASPEPAGTCAESGPAGASKIGRPGE
ncbi:MAG: OmpA family protein, partial [Gemmatimonadales bacterium]|nr:OmpA family protein [Gemmatimonadales bacterium]